ncbi:MAG TPA: hypothetical protein VFH29_06685, partial [Anaerolineales bacterium]|nr:hypothetical protein [Anaerolineales bacterium]
MEISILALIGIAIAAMFFGYFFGLLEGRGQGYKRGRKAAADERLEPVVSTATLATPAKSEKEQGLLVLGLNE